MPKVARSKTSTELTSTGSEIVLSGVQIEKGLQRLLQINDPREVDKALVSSVESILGSKVEPYTTVKYKENEAVFTLQRYILAENVDLKAIEDATVVVQQSMVGFPLQEIQERLAMLMTLLIKPSQESVDDVALRIKSLATELSKHPADIVVYAIEQIKKTQKFWPSYSEFYQYIGWREEKRLKLLEALKNKRLELTA